MTEALQHWVAHKTDQHISDIRLLLLLRANRAPYSAKLNKLGKRLRRWMKRGSAERRIGERTRPSKEEGRKWLNSYLGRWLKGDWSAQCATTPGVAQYPPTGASCAPSRGGPPHAAANSLPDDKPPFHLCSNLQPPTSTSNGLNISISWTRLGAGR